LGGEKLGIFRVERYVVKSEKKDEFTAAMNEYLRYREAHPDLFKGLKSWRILRQEYGAVTGMYMEIAEFDSLAELETTVNRVHQDEGIKKIVRKFYEVIDSATLSDSIWSPVATESWR
jgi:hypothetical protein